METMEFKDFNFKLAIIDILMYEEELIQPKFDVYEFVKQYKKRKIDIEEEGYEIIPEVKTYFEELEIPKELAIHIEEIYQDGGDDIYAQLIPLWDGESDDFSIKSADDTHYFSNLKKVILFYHQNNSKVLEKFQTKGIEAEWL